MASTSPFAQAESPSFGPLASSGARAARRAAALRDKASQRGEPTHSGFPAWSGLAPVVYFLMVPAALVLAIVITGGEWEWYVLYPIAALLGGYVFLSTFRTVELALACMLFYFPFSTSYVIPIAPGVNGTNMLVLLGLFASVLRVADKRQGWFAWPPGTAIVVLFAILSTLSGLTTVLTLPGGYVHLIHHEVLSYKGWIDQFIFYFIVLSCVRDVETAKRLFVYMILGSIILVLYSIPEMIDKGDNSTIEKSRIEGPHQQSNQFGGFVAYSLLPAVAVFVVYIRDARAWLLVPYLLIAAKVLITTFSRGAYLAIALGGLCAGFFKGRGFLAFWGMTMLAFFLVFPQMMPRAITERLGLTDDSAPNTVVVESSTDGPVELDKSSEHRLILWRAASKMILEDPFIGKGFKSFPKLKAQYTDHDVREGDPHNMYLYLGSQMGLPVLSLFLLLLGYSFWLGRTLSRHRTDRFIRTIGIGGASATACYAVICMFGSRAVNLEFTAYFWSLFAVMQVIYRFEFAAAAPVRRSRGTGDPRVDAADRHVGADADPSAPALSTVARRSRGDARRRGAASAAGDAGDGAPSRHATARHGLPGGSRSGAAAPERPRRRSAADFVAATDPAPDGAAGAAGAVRGRRQRRGA